MVENEMPTDYRFGWLHWPLTIQDADYKIRPAESFEKALSAVRARSTYTDAWFYLPSPQTYGNLHLASRFELEETHVLTTLHERFDRRFGEFLILVLGFLLGLRLTIEGTGHLASTPTKPGTLVDFVPRNRELLTGITQAAAFWHSSTLEQRNLGFAAIHWFLVSQSYSQQYEKFGWQYMVLDNVHRLTSLRCSSYKGNLGRIHHGEQPVYLAEHYKLPLPPSFSGVPKRGSQRLTHTGTLINLRNELFHEARWLEEPLGYKINSDAHEILANLRFFNSQLILGFLDIECAFRNAIFDHQRHGLDVL